MKVHVITGGGSGIGLEIAKAFDEGLVIITGRTEEKLKRACAELEKTGKAKYAYKTCDVSDKKSVMDLLEFALSKGDLMTVVNSAGVSGVGASVEAVLNVDLKGTKFITDAAYDYLANGGVLINIASMMGHIVPVNDAYINELIEPDKEGAVEKIAGIVNGNSDNAYNFAKLGVIEMVKANAMKFGKKGLRILSLSPGIIMTEMAKDAQEENADIMKKMVENTPAQRTGEPSDIANAVKFLASDEASFITGTDLLVDGGLSLVLKSMYQ